MQFETTIGVELRGAAKTYRNAGTAVHAVRGIDVSIALGETVAPLGPNGAGKSTTIDMLLGLISPDSGSVSLLGVPPREAVAAGTVGAMLQAGALIRDVTVRELRTMMAALYPHPLGVGEAVELASLTNFAGRRTHKLSGGQAQRVRFAIALVPDPSVLVLDEPTVGLDVEARRAFWLSVREFAARGKTIVFATHYMEEADAYADRAVLMSRGPGRCRRPDGRDPRPGGYAHDSRHASRRRSDRARCPAGRRRGRPARRFDRADLHGFRRREPRPARRLPRRAQRGDRQRRARGRVSEFTGAANETIAESERREALI